MARCVVAMGRCGGFWVVMGCLVTAACSREEPVARSRAAASSRPTERATSATPAGRLIDANTHAVISGVLSWNDPGLAAFSAERRRDAALFEQLGALGVPASQRTLLLDDAASKQGIMTAVSAALETATKGSTFVFYYAGHGLRSKGGEAFFACHDITSSDPAASGLSLRALGDVIAERFRGRRVILLADCCFSGSLGAVAERLRKKGLEVVSLTSAAAANVSTGNWTYTMSLLSCLGGDPLCDADGDGHITLGELGSEVRAAMKNLEGQRYGMFVAGVPEATRVAKARSTSLAAEDRRTFMTAPGTGVPAVRLVARRAKGLTVRRYHYAHHTEVAVADAQPVRFERHPVGAPLRVYWGGKIWDAKVERVDGDFHFISYPGWGSHYDEWITSRRIASEATSAEGFDVGALIQVEWKGRWYPARVLARQGMRYRIHYDGHDASWDEWVPPSRVQKR